MPLKKHSFTDLVRIEQLRKIESAKAEQLSYASVADMEKTPVSDFRYTNFTHCLTTRANRLIQDNTLEDAINKPQDRFRHAGILSLFIAAILGGLAAVNAVSESHTLNIYWLLTVLLGFNFLSLLLWLIGITCNLQSLINGVVAQLAAWWSFRKKDAVTTESLAASAWWENCLTGAVGKWRISVLTHQFWLVYLAAGLGLLILLMLAKQYNFIWGTTLLPESSLPKLTESLGKPLALIGLEVPDSEQIATSRMDETWQKAETRSAWARFLIGVLLVYGLLPRCLLLTFSVAMQKWSERRFKLDLYLPYYIDLRQRLMTRKVSSRVIDADPVAREEPVQVPQSHHVNDPLPGDAYAVGIELDDQISWPDSIACQLNVVDMQTQEQAIERLKKLQGTLLIGVAAYRLPDRGVQRIVRDLLTAASTCSPWLVLLNKQTAVPVTSSRELAWFRLAEACEIPAEHVITQSDYHG